MGEAGGALSRDAADPLPAPGAWRAGVGGVGAPHPKGWMLRLPSAPLNQPPSLPGRRLLDCSGSAAGVLVCLLEYPRGRRTKGSTMERW